jgi:hypothetical protein
MSSLSVFPVLNRVVACAVMCSVLAACETPVLLPPTAPPEPGVKAATRDGPADAVPGTCWGKTVSPAVIETVSVQIQVKPAKINPDGTIAGLPVYRTEARQKIVTPRRDNWFETPCAEVLSPVFTSSLQRALAARGIYSGKINGEMDRKTRNAVQVFQQSRGGPASEVLSLEAARALGLVSVEQTASQ